MFHVFKATLHTGNGHSHLDRILKIIGLPGMDAKTFTKHERVVGPIIEKIALDSCQEAAELERELTIEHMEKIKSML